MDEQSTGTFRQKILELLKTRPFDAGALSRALGIKQREVEAHLTRVLKSAKSQGLKIVIDPARCGECGFAFKDRERTTKPSRCPKCRSEHLLPPAFSIEA